MVAHLFCPTQFKTPLGRQVFQAIFQPPKRDVSQMFLPRRTAFVYDLEDGEALDIPTTLHRSKADCPKAGFLPCQLPVFLNHT